MTIAAIYSFLNALSPFELQEKWDNSGLNIGDMSFEVDTIYLALDIDKELLSKVAENSLIITHHPLIFGNLSELDFTKYPANLIRTMVKKNISHIAMHTNFDKTHLNRYVFEEILGFRADSSDSEYIVTTHTQIKKETLLATIREKLGLSCIKVVNPKDEIHSLALATGSGASMIDDVRCECFLTGDIKYHDAHKAAMQDLMLVEIGHFESERFFVDIMADKLKVLPISAIIINSKNPFIYENQI